MSETIDQKVNEINCQTIEAKDEKEDEFSYTKRGEFTSETHKIEVRNLPRHIGYDTFKKLFKKLDLKPLKMKLIGRPGAPTHSFITFRCDEDRDQAIDKLNNYLWKSKELVVKKANPIPDPLVEKRKEFKLNEDLDSKRIKSEDKELPIVKTAEQMSEDLNDRIASLWRTPYSQQIVQKFNSIQSFLIKFNKELNKVVVNSTEEWIELKEWLKSMAKTHDNKCCQLNVMRVSPVINGYRNKCEFTVGIDKTVGFRLGLYKEGTVRVITPAADCPIIGEKMRNALNGFQMYVKNESSLEGYDPERHSGHWIQVTVRTSSTDCMIIIGLHSQQLTQNQINEEKEKISNFFEKNTNFGINSVFIHISSKRHENWSKCLEHLFGAKEIYETIDLDSSLRFRISPLAFFQINTIGAEICYKSIIELIKPNPNLIVLDICCGTGTIGLCLASKVKKVIGIELNTDAINDAKFNAELNGIKNIQFIEGKAEEVIASALDSCGYDSEIVAVIDPPRAGLNNSIIRLLRSNGLINRLVYVSCDPNKAFKNMIEPPSKTYKGQPFVPIEVIPVDMFPHTDRCELILLFERLNSKAIKSE